MTLLALDRAEDALQAIDGIIAESLKRGFSWFLHVAELTRGQMLLQVGRLEEAYALLEGRFDPHGPPVTTSMDAAGLAALGRLALHRGDGRQVRQASEIARAMLERDHARRSSSRRLVPESASSGRRRSATGSPVAVRHGEARAQRCALQALAGCDR